MVKITKVYTKTGDKGETSLAANRRVKKYDLRIQLIGEVDELNAHIAFALESIRNIKSLEITAKSCFRIQHQLFNLGASLAVLTQDRRPSTPTISSSDILLLEEEIDFMNDSLPTLNSFILPGGSEEAARFHLARTVCRRAERTASRLCLEEVIDETILPYLNRLSDWLFVASRYVLLSINKAEALWDPAKAK